MRLILRHLFGRGCVSRVEWCLSNTRDGLVENTPNKSQGSYLNRSMACRAVVIHCLWARR